MYGAGDLSARIMRLKGNQRAVFSARKKTLCFSNLYNFFPVNPVFQVHL
jgi:hypothetical protein